MGYVNKLSVDGVSYDVQDSDAQSKIGDLTDLDTTNKSNLVAAINEAAQSGGGGAVASVNGQTGTVVLGAGDIGYDDTATYSADTVGEAVGTLKSQIMSKLDSPATEGTSGQVLATDGDGGRYWTTVQGGGGGTTDYTALSNKPQINGVTLSGNKSLTDT